MGEGEFRQQSQFPVREAPAGASVSEDNAASVAATAALQAEAQRRILTGRQSGVTGRMPAYGEQIGSQP